MTSKLTATTSTNTRGSCHRLDRSCIKAQPPVPLSTYGSSISLEYFQLQEYGTMHKMVHTDYIVCHEEQTFLERERDQNKGGEGTRSRDNLAS
jgi:hypothetical protein